MAITTRRAKPLISGSVGKWDEGKMLKDQYDRKDALNSIFLPPVTFPGFNKLN